MFRLRSMVSRAFGWIVWAVVDVPLSDGNGVRFSGVITLGNVLQILVIIIGGIGVLLSVMVRFSAVEDHIQRVECSLAQAGIMVTTVPCTFVNVPKINR